MKREPDTFVEQAYKMYKTPKDLLRIKPMELLCFIFVVTLFTAILAPQYAKEKRNRKALICSYNLEKLYRAALQYVNDYDGFLPPVSSGGGKVDRAGALENLSKTSFSCVKGADSKSNFRGINLTETPTLLSAEGKKTVLAADCKKGSSAVRSYSDVAYRHFGISQINGYVPAANFLFVDGHITLELSEKQGNDLAFKERTPRKGDVVKLPIGIKVRIE